VTVWSYVDRMNVTLLTCPDLLPDLDALTAELPPALDELLASRPRVHRPERQPQP
jgi:diacylglycerol O-acyltransferase